MVGGIRNYNCRAHYGLLRRSRDSVGLAGVVMTTRRLFAYIRGKRQVMNREQIIARIRENETALRRQGVVHAAVFGSRARGDAKPESDTDIMIEFDPAARITVYDYAGVKDYLVALFDGPVDVVNRIASSRT